MILIEKEEKEEAENYKKTKYGPKKLLGKRKILPGLVDDKEVIIAFVDQLEVDLPAEFEGFSITLGALFQNNAETNKTFYINCKAWSGKRGLIQVDVLRSRNIILLELMGIVIILITKLSSDKVDFVNVQKVGRTTHFKKGLIQDIRFALRVIGIDGQAFSECGDSGAPVFDDDGTLWIIKRVTFVVPIHLILDDVMLKKKFNDVVFTLREDELEKSSQKDTKDLF
ncbi:19304_t:CDS:2 [Funneliformis geosporum]|nr:19304_t:CDS:2 [Funneliformis geosporum]